MIELTTLSEINRREGYAAGDSALHQLALALEGALGGITATAGRFSGRRLAVVLPDTGHAAASAIAARVAESFDGARPPIRTSVAVWRHGDHGEDVLSPSASGARRPRIGGRRPSSLRRRCGARFALWLLLFAAYAATLGLHASGDSDYAGDEPHYLLAAKSVVDDGDVDVRDEYASRAYEDFHPYELERLGSPTDGRLNEPIGTGFPLLIAPAYALGGASGSSCSWRRSPRWEWCWPTGSRCAWCPTRGRWEPLRRWACRPLSSPTAPPSPPNRPPAPRSPAPR